MSNYFSMNKTANTWYSPFMHPTVGTKIYNGVVEYNAYVIANATSMKTALDRIGFNSNGYPTSPTTDSVVYSIANARYETWDGYSWISAGLTDGDFSFNYSKYIQAWKIEADFGKTDILYIMLGTNDFMSLQLSEFSNAYNSYKSNMDALISSAKAYNPDIKIGIGLANTYTGSDWNNEGTFASHTSRLMYEARKNNILNYDNRIAENIYIVDWGIS